MRLDIHYEGPGWKFARIMEFVQDIEEWTDETTEENIGVTMPLKSTPISLPVVLAVGVTFLQMIVDEDLLTGWHGAAAKGLLTLLKRFSPGSGQVAKLQAAHILQSLPPTSEHDDILEEFPTKSITPQTVQAWGEALASQQEEGESE